MTERIIDANLLSEDEDVYLRPQNILCGLIFSKKYLNKNDFLKEGV